MDGTRREMTGFLEQITKGGKVQKYGKMGKMKRRPTDRPN
jgi:hypothetical protein